MELQEEIIVGIGQVVVHHNPITLTTLGIGSCVAVALFDKENQIGGLAHIMLPNSKEYAGKINENREIIPLLKYADIAIPHMVSEMIKIGAKKENLHAKLAGGAQMFASINSENLQIGLRNVTAVKQILKECDIHIDAEDVQGNVGRSVRFDTAKLILRIKTMNGEKEI